MSKTYILSASLLASLTITACGGVSIIKKPNMEKAEYWQRQSASSAVYMQGPKAQQLLHQDIANCTVEIRELENLGEIRRALPANYSNGNELRGRTAAQATLDQWDSPERDGYMRNEHLDYSDFETCMVYKGWERAEYLPYTDADKARKDYLKRSEADKKRKKTGDRENVTSLNPKSQTPPPYKNLND